jgi:hypothetical protein
VSDPRLHHRQFVLGPEPVLADEAWLSEEIGPSLHLSRCRDLPAEYVTDRRGRRWHLLGIAVQSAPGRASPPEQLAGHGSEGLLEVYGTWSGRWILVGESELHLDASGLLGCFYRRIRHGSTTELWASSSPALLATLPGRPLLRSTEPRIHWEKGMDWYPPPRSRFAGVSRLLPTQVLSLAPEGGGPVSARPPLVPVGEPGNYESTLDELQRILLTSLANLRGRDEQLRLPLTGGLDSRLILAAAKELGLPVSTFTFRYRSTATGDRALPPLLAGELGYEHQFVRPAALSRRRRALFDAHTAEHCVGIDRRYFARGQWGAFRPPVLVLRGGVFEVGRCFYHRKFPYAATDDLAETIAARFRFREFHADSQAHLEGIAEWAEWVDRTPCPGLDWRDRLYVEQRLGGWASSIEQALDLTAYERVYVANSHLYISTVLTLPEEMRLVGRHHVDLVRRMAPDLLRFPFNPPDDALVKLSFRVRNEWQELVARPRKAGYAAYVARRGIRSAGRITKRAVGRVPRYMR